MDSGSKVRKSIILWISDLLCYTGSWKSLTNFKSKFILHHIYSHFFSPLSPYIEKLKLPDAEIFFYRSIRREGVIADIEFYTQSGYWKIQSLTCITPSPLRSKCLKPKDKLSKFEYWILDKSITCTWPKIPVKTPLILSEVIEKGK